MTLNPIPPPFSSRPPASNGNGHRPPPVSHEAVITAASRWAQARRQRQTADVVAWSQRRRRDGDGRQQQHHLEALVASAIDQRGAIPAWAFGHPSVLASATAAGTRCRICRSPADGSPPYCVDCADIVEEARPLAASAVERPPAATPTITAVARIMRERRW